MHQKSKILKFSGVGFPYHIFLKESKFLQIFVLVCPPLLLLSVAVPDGWSSGWLVPVHDDGPRLVKPDTGSPFVIVARILAKYLLERSIHRNGFNFYPFLQI